MLKVGELLMFSVTNCGRVNDYLSLLVGSHSTTFFLLSPAWQLVTDENILPPHLRDADLSYSQFRQSLDIFVWIVGPRRTANHFKCAT